jgi:hypothetical protein
VLQECDGVPAVGDAIEETLNPILTTDMTEANGNLIQEFRIKLSTWVHYTPADEGSSDPKYKTVVSAYLSPRKSASAVVTGDLSLIIHTSSRWK